MRFLQMMTKFKNKFLDALYPKHIKCIFCNGELSENSFNDTCNECMKSLPFITHACARCGVSIPEYNDGVCLACTRNNYSFTTAKAVFDYSDKVVKVVHDFKYNSRKYLFEPMAEFMCMSLKNWNVKFDIVTSVPMFKQKEKAKGYNHSKLLAEYIAQSLGLPYLDLCEKVKDNSSQTTHNFKERQENVKDCYKLLPGVNKQIENKNILLIDDIFTTGATATNVSSEISKAKTNNIYVFTFAHTVIEREI